jgi:transcriptional regulator with XRE-family HTH domain
MGNRLKILREKKSMTLQDAADAMNVSYGQYVKLERGERRLTDEYIQRAAKAFDVSPSQIIDSQDKVRKIGYIGAGQTVEAVEFDPDEEVDAPADAKPGTVAAEVRGESMLPIFHDGWLIYWSTLKPPSTMVNRMGVYQLADGRIMVKTLRQGSKPGYWTLTSFNAADVVDVILDWGAEIDWIKPR